MLSEMGSGGIYGENGTKMGIFGICGGGWVAGERVGFEVRRSVH